ncbi:hypothetical protein EWM64_g1297 [Hericium alpestre]|uniref:Bromo domain-containing protein n=1 Tax=Hericium alpestre TaxID=135208 RepID=A0A4Z0A8R6_9AGAM|nr:hypothetical protein EWM64_g1297 [Hericium alpestre]
MASATRSRRVTDLVPEDLSNLERLILAQAVYELGANAWPAVAKLLSEHPLISQPHSSFSPESCQAAYEHLMKEATLESDCRVLTITKLRELIVAEEGKFKAVVAEIDAIRSGAWDEQIREKLGISKDEEKPPSVQVADVPETEGLSPANQPEGDDVQLSSDGKDESHPEVPSPASPEEQSVIDLTEEPDVETVAPEEQDNFPETHEPEPEQHLVETPLETMEDREEQPEVSLEGTRLPSPSPVEPSEEAEATPVPEPNREVEAAGEDEDIAMDEATPEAQRDQEESPEISHRDFKRKASELEGVSETERDKKRAREESQVSQVDEDEDAAPSPGPSRRRGARPVHEVTPATKKFQNVIIMLHSQISQHRNGNIFHNPIKNSEAPDYREIVKRPMDLKTIKMRIKDGAISNSAQFQRDVYLMFANSMMYNRPKSDIYNMAEEMMLVSEVQINEFLQTEGIIRGGHRL